MKNGSNGAIRRLNILNHIAAALGSMLSCHMLNRLPNCKLQGQLQGPSYLSVVMMTWDVWD